MRRAPWLARALAWAALATCAGKVSHIDPEAGRRPVHPDGDIAALVVVAIGRTGSTLLSELFSAVPGAFVVVEPYKKFLVINKSDRRNKEQSPGQMPTMASILDCSFASSADRLNAVRWPFFCMHSRIVSEANASDFQNRCQADAPLDEADAAMVRQHCRSSRVRVIKTIRFAQATGPARQSLAGLAASPGYTVHLVHVVRHPFKVLTSQYNLGWYDVLQVRRCAPPAKCSADAEPRELDREQAEAAARHVASLGGTVCGLLRAATNAVRELAPAVNTTAVLRYEDLAPPYTGATFAALCDAFGVTGAVAGGFDAAATADAVSRQGHATFRITGQEVREAHTAAAAHAGEAQRTVALDAECAPVYAEFNYGPWPPGGG